MDLLESVLRSSNAEDYIDTFHNNNIEAPTLPLLTEDDLKIIGVENPDVRENILKKASTLQIPQEKKIDLTVTKEYADEVLNQISHQLLMHYASLSYVAKRKDVVVCNVKLHPASQCLLKCISSLEQELDKIKIAESELTEDMVRFVKNKRQTKQKRMLLIVGTSGVALLLLGIFVKSLRK